MGWSSRNAEAIEAGAAVVTALVAVMALVGVKFQIDANDRRAAVDSAREIYREFLALSVANPHLAEPGQCNILEDPAYDAYLEYLLYTAEQTIALDADWEPVIVAWIEEHPAAVCSIEDWSGYTDEVEALIRRTQIQICAAQATCTDGVKIPLDLE